MMKKVPVGASIAHAYEFLFGRFFQIIGTAWVPALLYGLGYFVYLSSVPAIPVTPGHMPDGAQLGQLVVTIVVALAFFLMVRSVLGISLTQEALGVRKDLTLAHFVIGPRELRLFFGYLRYYLVFFLLYIALIAVCIGLGVGAKLLSAKYAVAVGGVQVLPIAAAVVGVVLGVAFVLAMLRLAFLLAPVASAEHRTRLARAWELSRGSGWRVLVVLVATLLPVVIAFCATAYYAIGPGEFAALIKAMQAAKPGNPSSILSFSRAHAPMLSFLTAIYASIQAALIAGASAHAYRVTSGHEDPELEDDAALVAPLLAPEHEAPAEDHGHHGHDDHGHGGHGGHDDHGHGGHDDHGHGEEESHDDGHGHEEHGHGGHDDHGHGGHGDHGHGGHDDHGHGGHDDHGHGGHDDHGHGGHDDHGHGGHDDHGHGGHDDHGHGGHDDHGHGGHDDHGHGGHDDHGHGGHGDHGHSSHGDGHHHAADAHHSEKTHRAA